MVEEAYLRNLGEGGKPFGKLAVCPATMTATVPHLSASLNTSRAKAGAESTVPREIRRGSQTGQFLLFSRSA